MIPVLAFFVVTVQKMLRATLPFHTVSCVAFKRNPLLSVIEMFADKWW